MPKKWAMAMPQPLVEIIDLKKYYPVRRGFLCRKVQPVGAVEGVSLQIFPGETVALMGESGSGKTTLAHCLFRIIRPTAGIISFKGEQVWSMAGERLCRFRREAQFIFQEAEAALNPRLTLGDMVAEPLVAHRMLSGKAARHRAQELLQQVGLEEYYFAAFPSELSAGQRHRAVIARALALQPIFLAADEPFSSLDVLAKSRLLDLFLSLQKQLHLTYFFISHDWGLVQQCATRVATMREGKIAEVHAFKNVI